MLACLLADGIMAFGMPGWRVAFLCVAAVSAATGAATLKLAKDPLAAFKEPVGLVSVFGHLRSFLTVPTFVIIVVQASSQPSRALRQRAVQLICLCVLLQISGASCVAVMHGCCLRTYTHMLVHFISIIIIIMILSPALTNGHMLLESDLPHTCLMLKSSQHQRCWL